MGLTPIPEISASGLKGGGTKSIWVKELMMSSFSAAHVVGRAHWLVEVIVIQTTEIMSSRYFNGKALRHKSRREDGGLSVMSFQTPEDIPNKILADLILPPAQELQGYRI